MGRKNESVIIQVWNTVARGYFIMFQTTMFHWQVATRPRRSGPGASESVATVTAGSLAVAKMSPMFRNDLDGLLHHPGRWQAQGRDSGSGLPPWSRRIAGHFWSGRASFPTRPGQPRPPWSLARQGELSR